MPVMGVSKEVYCVIPEHLVVAFVAFLNRDRKFSPIHFFRTHSTSRKTALEIAEHYPAIPIKVIISSTDYIGRGATMHFREIELDSNAAQIDFLKGNQYTENEIRAIVFHSVVYKNEENDI